MGWFGRVVGVIASTIAVVAIAVGSQVRELRPFRENTTVVYSAEKMPLLAWVFAHWRADGFSVPEDGETFVWNKYAVNIPPLFQLAPKQWECQNFSSIETSDVVFFPDESGDIDFGMVFESDVGDRTKVGIMQPIPGGLLILQSIERSNVLGVGRPIVKRKFVPPVSPTPHAGGVSI
jgi:hypothetical protein